MGGGFFLDLDRSIFELFKGRGSTDLPNGDLMKQHSLVATGILMFLLMSCNSQNSNYSFQTLPSPTATQSHSPASISGTKAEGTSTEPPAEIFRKELPRLKQQTGVPILLPSKLPDFAQPVYVSATGDRTSYSITLSSTPNCTANACFIGSFQAKRGKQSSFDQSISLAKHHQGFYKPLSCGASCSPPAIAWVDQRVLYEIQMSLPKRDKEVVKTAFIQMANSAIEAGAR